MVTEVTRPVWECLRCQHGWVGRVEHRPSFCPACGARKWWEERSKHILRLQGIVIMEQDHPGHNKYCECSPAIIIKASQSPQCVWLDGFFHENDEVIITVKRKREE